MHIIIFLLHVCNAICACNDAKASFKIIELITCVQLKYLFNTDGIAIIIHFTLTYFFCNLISNNLLLYFILLATNLSI